MFEALEVEVERTRLAYEEARRIYDRTNIEVRQIKALHKAELNHTVALRELRVARERVQRQAEKEEAEQRRLARRAPPCLEDFVMMHGISDVATRKMVSGYERITPEEWAKWEADMAEWKRKVREGLFDAKIW